MSVSKFLQGFKGPGGFVTGTKRDTGISITGGSNTFDVANFSRDAVKANQARTFVSSAESTGLTSFVENQNQFNTKVNQFAESVKNAFSSVGQTTAQVPTTQPKRVETQGSTGPIETNTFTESFSEGLKGIQNILGPTGIVIGIALVGVILLKR